MTQDQALIVAKQAYSSIIRVIEDWEERSEEIGFVCFHWDGCVSVDGYLFHERELK